VAIVRLGKLPINRENPYASLSTSERYECFMKRVAEVWSAICKRENAGVLRMPGQAQRKAA
jgi:hypothetical protein